MKRSIMKFVLLLVCLTGVSLAYSQENFVSGSIIKLNGDTVKGYVDYRNWEKNPNKIKFKEGENSKIMEYNPLQIGAFVVSDEIYKSAIVKVDQSNSGNEISSTPVFEFRTDTTFVLTLIQGSKNLYYYADKNNQSNFYIYNNSKFELLEFKKFNRIHESEDLFDAYKGHLVQEMNNRYIGQLKLYFQNCNIPESMYQNLSYTKESIQKIYKYYYSHMKNENVIIRKTDKAKLEFGVLGGLCTTKIKFTNNLPSEYIVFDYLAKVNFDAHLSLAAGAYLNVVFPWNNGKWSLYNELLINSYAFHGFYSNFTNSTYYQNKTYNLEYYYINMNNMIRFKYPVGKVYLYVNTGISNGFAFKEVNHAIVETRLTSEPKMTEEKAIEDTRKYEQGFLLGLGLLYKKYSVEFRYEGGNGILQLTHLSSSTYRYNVLLGYRF